MTWFLVIWLISSTATCDGQLSRVTAGTYATQTDCEATFTGMSKGLNPNQTLSHICVRGTSRPT